MAGDEDKKKKKKSKKTEKPVVEEAPPAPEPAPADEEPDWLSAAQAEVTSVETTDMLEGTAPPAEDTVVEGDDEVMAEAPPVPKKKPKFFIHWDRRKPKLYDYNFDYGEKYYSPLVNYLDHKNLGACEDLPRRKAFAERGIDVSVCRKSQPDVYTQTLMHNVRNSIRGYEDSQRAYAYNVDRKYFE